jgi:hypothetical protein
MAFVHGKSAVFKLDNSSGRLWTIRHIWMIGFPRSIETAETTTFGSSAKSYITGLTDATVSLSGKFDATADGTLAGVSVKRQHCHLSTAQQAQLVVLLSMKVNAS